MFAIFSTDECFFFFPLSACLALLTAEEDACNDEGAGSSKGRWSNGKSIFALLEECSGEGEERRASVTSRNSRRATSEGGN